MTAEMPERLHRVDRAADEARILLPGLDRAIEERARAPRADDRDRHRDRTVGGSDGHDFDIDQCAERDERQHDLQRAGDQFHEAQLHDHRQRPAAALVRILDFGGIVLDEERRGLLQDALEKRVLVMKPRFSGFMNAGTAPRVAARWRGPAVPRRAGSPGSARGPRRGATARRSGARTDRGGNRARARQDDDRHDRQQHQAIGLPVGPQDLGDRMRRTGFVHGGMNRARRSPVGGDGRKSLTE